MQSLLLILFACCTHTHTHRGIQVRCPRKPEDGIRFPEAGTTGTVNHLIWALGTEMGASQKQYSLLTSAPSLWPQIGLLSEIFPHFFIGHSSLAGTSTICLIYQVCGWSMDGLWKVSSWMNRFEKLTYLPGQQLKWPRKNYSRKEVIWNVFFAVELKLSLH